MAESTSVEASHATSDRRRGRRWRLLPLVGLVVLLLFGAVQLAAPLLGLRGEVRDAQTGTPLAGALARAGTEAARTGPNGFFELGSVPPWQTVSFEAEGYGSYSVPSLPFLATSVTLPPLVADVRVVDDDSGQLIAASLESDFGRVQSLDVGRFRVGPIKPGVRLTARADNYGSLSTEYAGGPAVELRLAQVRLGSVVDRSSGQPVVGALVLADEQFFRTGRDGRFELPGRPKRPLRVMAPGYRRLEVDTNAAGSLDLRVEPFAVRGLYLTFYGVGSDDLRANALRLLRTSEANALVVDIKGDRGYLAYQSRVPLAGRIGANANPTLPDVDRFLADLHANGHYAIARIVVFKDDLLARNGAAAGLDVAIKDRRTGETWVDGEGLGWVDPFRREVWEYNVAIAQEAAERGFDEIQFDYIRFPTDPSSATSVNNAVYSREPTEANRPDAIVEFLKMSHEALLALGAFLSVDTFGYACWRDDDMGIGQNLAMMAPHVDYISPMVYPSTYNAGLPGKLNYPGVVARPYDVVFESMEQARTRTAGHSAVLRPWLQYFDDYPWATGRSYNAAEIQAQKKAAADAGSVGWMMWDPFNRYARGGFNPR
jgi:hypothetical protein